MLASLPARLLPTRPAAAMFEPLPDHGLHASLVGPIAARALHDGAHGRVRAVFDRSFYLSLDAGMVCVGSAGLGGGPLNLVCEGWPGERPLRTFLSPGAAARIDDNTCAVGALTIFLARAQGWRPEPVSVWNKVSLARGLAAATELLRLSRPKDGLGVFNPAATERVHPLLRAAEAPLGYLRQVLREDAATVRAGISGERIAPLIGLGPGLTPSGDDCLAGVLVALAVIGRTALRDKLWQALEPLLPRHTTDISRAHLAAAAEGLASAGLHRLLTAILSGAIDTIPDAMTTLASIGHTSGWDALAGARLVLCSPWLSSPR
jgi:hypothetical protein